MSAVAVTLGRRASAAAAVTGGAVVVGAAMAMRPSLTLLAVAACVAATVFIVWPDAVTLGVIFLLYMNVPAVLVKDHGFPLTIAALVPLLLVVPLAFHLYRRRRFVLDRTFVLLLVYLIIQLVSTSFSTNQHDAAEKLKTFGLEGVVLYALVTNVVRTPTVLRRAVWAIVAAASLLSTVTIFQNVTHTYARPYGGFSLVDSSFFLGHAVSPRASGPIGDPNYYGQLLLVALALALLTCWRERTPRLKLAAAAASAVIAIAITFTFSRGAGFGFLLVLVIMTFLRYISGRQLLALGVGVLVLLFAFPAYRERVATIGNLGGATAETGSEDAADVSTRGRATEMLAAALVFADHPVVGVGPDVFPDYYQRYAQQVGIEVHETVGHGRREGEQAQRQSHNMFLSVAADLGVFGLLTFIAIIVSTIWTLAQARRRWLKTRPDLAALATGFMLGVVAYVTTGLFLTLAYERYFWLLVALAGAGGSLALSREAVEGEDA
jgi:O-antigen ligase